MNTWAKPIAVLLLIVGSAFVMEPRASAQLGSLVVTITSPTPGSTVTGTTSVNAQVSIIGFLTVTQVQFRLDGANLGAADTNAPYSIPWDTRTASNGSHTLTAVARDGLGINWTSQPVNVTVFNDLTPPSVTLTSPTPGAVVRGSITMTATASDNVGVAGVQFRLNGANFGAEDTTAPYSMPWDTTAGANGTHLVTAVARDAAGNTSTATQVSVTVDNSAPAVSVTAPAGGATVSGSITVTANASDNMAVAGVQFFVDGAPLGAEDVTVPYAAAWNTTTASNGSHTVTAVARDAVGNTATSASVTVTIDNSPPAVSITSPSAASTVSASITVTAGASDNVAVAGVQFFLDGAPLGAEDTSAPYAVSWDTTTATNGSHSLTAAARDAAGNSATSAAVSITVLNDTTPPAVSITSPAAAATVSGSIAVTASASDNVAVAGVQFFIDGTMLGVEDTTEPYAVSWDTTTASNGSRVLTAVARDGSGNSATSAAVTVTVRNDTTPPSVTITSPANASTVGGTVTVTADASDDVAVAGVRFSVDGAPLGAEDTSVPYEVSWDTTFAADGPHTLTAVARDEAGNTTTSAAVSVTVANAPATTVTRIEDNGTGIAFTPAGSWIEGYDGGFGWSGGTAALGFSAGQVATLNFSGTEVSWIGFRGPQTGRANVHLDGTLVATIDPYSATQVVGAVLYTATGLADGPHTLAIEPTRTKNDASSDYFVVVDAFDVTSSGGAPADTTAPAISITSPAGDSTVSATVTIAASASDNASVAGVKFFVDGVQVGAEDTADPYEVSWNTTATSNGSHQLTAQARDGAGNIGTSAAISVTVSNTTPPPAPPAAVATRFEDTDLTIAYTPGTLGPGQPPAWFHGSRSRGWSNGTSSFNRSAGSRATFAFTGTSVSWIGFRAYWAGIARVYVDDEFVREIDLFLPPCTAEQRAQGCVDEDDQVPVFTADGLSEGPHTLTVEVTGGKNANATDNAVVVDAFDVAPATPSTIIGTRIEETVAAVIYTAGWTQGDTTTAWSGGTAAVSATPGARATVTFTGTEVRWVGRRGPQAGIARIFLDDAFQAEFDQYFPTDAIGVNYTATGLAPGSHTLTIEVTGTRNAAATGVTVALDAFDVRSRFEEPDAAVAYSGAWTQEDMDRPWSGTTPNNGSGTAARSATAGASAEFTFSGTDVQWISVRAPNLGIADVFLDGEFKERVDLYAAAETMRDRVFSAFGLASGSHTLRIEVTGLKNAASAGAFVFVDAFDVVLPEPAPPVTRIQQTDSSVAYDAAWAHTSANLYYSGRTVAFTTTAGSQATFTFTGTSVRWIGQRRRDAGIARVYLDGVLIREVDTFAPIQDEFQAAVFSATGLNPGTHTLTIEATGTKHGGDTCTPSPGPSPPPCSAGYLVIVDAFEVYQE